ncbi:DUF3152 domain-containing protein [Antrihabitans stalactiti]|uniref:DUF3152 domain-containing protein n=1 Tax=Antrihabitans stalactiti TaxID=2584121 RepID=A0A848KCH2_9NOCA|nr:DUF3152 domain-containing protein [Antrihabitans stalactiti]
MTEHGGPRERGSLPTAGRPPSPFDEWDADVDESRRSGHVESHYAAAGRTHQPLRAQWDPTTRADGKTRPQRPERRTKKQSRVGRFVTTYGWRAYAIPFLAILTVVVGYDAIRNVTDSVEGLDDPGFGILSTNTKGSATIGAPPPGSGKFAANIPTGALPDGGPFTEAGAGTWHIVLGGTNQVGAGQEHVFTYTVEVEDGTDTSSFGGDESFARMVDLTLANPKSWTKDPRFAFRRIDQGQPDFRVSLTTQMTTRQACGYDIPLDTSCYNQGMGRVVLNEARWVRGAIAFDGDIGSYRQYQINHEVGHAIGYEQHQPCDVDGGLAPIMMQQSFGTANNDIATLDPEGVVPMDGKVCRFNPWPYPRG